jgi:hypothetical protein
MAGMNGLGRVFDVIPIASGVIFKFRGASAVTFVCTGADTFTTTVGTTHATAATSPGNIFTYYYQRADTTGAAAWTKQTQAASNAIVQGSAYTTVFTLYTSQVADPNAYVKCLASASGLVTAILHDLVVQRAPANLETLNT